MYDETQEEAAAGTRESARLADALVSISGLVRVLDIRPERGRLDYGSGLAVLEDSGRADGGFRQGKSKGESMRTRVLLQPLVAGNVQTQSSAGKENARKE